MVISKDKFQSILNSEDNHIKEPEDIFIEQVINKHDNHYLSSELSIILCSLETEHYFKPYSDEFGNVLTCNDIRYLNSINHLDNVKTILIDCSIFEDMKEIAFLCRVFQLLHRNVRMILCCERDYRILSLKRNLHSTNNVYVIYRDEIHKGVFSYMMSIDEFKEAKIKKRISWLAVLKAVFMIILIVSVIGAGILTYFSLIGNENNTIHNRNMNVQIDMSNSTIFPISTVYGDDSGNHIIIEELTESDTSTVSISLYDDEQKKVAADVQKISCPSQQCQFHHELIFGKDDSIDYYILQIEDSMQTKNIEIDKVYFE